MIIKNKNQLTILFINVSMLIIIVAVATFFIVFLARSLNFAINGSALQGNGVVRFNVEKAKEVGL